MYYTGYSLKIARRVLSIFSIHTHVLVLYGNFELIPAKIGLNFFELLKNRAKVSVL